MNRKRRFARKGGVALVGWTKAYLETRKFEPSISVFNPIYRKMNYNNLILILLAEWFKKKCCLLLFNSRAVMVRDSYPKVSLQERNQPVGVSFYFPFRCVVCVFFE